MQNILNITNGDSTVEIMKKAKISGTFLPWRDVLHDGPVPSGLTLDELSAIRAEFIISRGWGAADDTKQSFIERDNLLKSSLEFEKIILWFEHDLYDQLQILQILDWFHDNHTNKVALSIICTDQYLGRLSPDEMIALQQHETPITSQHLKLANEAWSAFRQDSPKQWNRLLIEDTSVLPFLEGAIIRMLEEYPSCSNGLSRTAQQALKVLTKDEQLAGKVFSQCQALEERIFLGDSGFWSILQEFIDSSPPLVLMAEGTKLSPPTANSQKLSITRAGLDVLFGRRNWLDITDQNRWVGGVHLEEEDVYCWNPTSGSILKKS